MMRLHGTWEIRDGANSLRSGVCVRRPALAAGAVVLSILGCHQTAPEQSYNTEELGGTTWRDELPKRIDELIGTAQPKGENSAPLYEAALDAYEGVEEEVAGPEHERWRLSELLYTLTEGEWEDPPHAEGREALRLLEPTIFLIHAASTAPKFQVLYREHQAETGQEPETPIVHVSEAISMMLDRLQALRRLHAAPVAAMRRSGEAGDWVNAQRHAATCLRIAEHAALPPMLISWLVSISLEQSTLRQLRLLALEIAMPADAAAGLIDLLQRHSWPAVSPHHVLAFERLYVDAQVRTWLGMSRAEQQDEIESRLELLAGLAVAGDEVRSLAGLAEATPRDWRRAYRTLFSMDPEDVSAEFQRYFEAVARHWDATLDAPPPPAAFTFAARPEALQPLVQEMGLGPIRTARMVASVRSTRTGTMVLLRLAAHRDRHGAWPERLTDAMTEDQATDPMSGEMFEYQVTPEGETPIRLAIPEAAREVLSLPGREDWFDGIRLLTEPRTEIYVPVDGEGEVEPETDGTHGDRP